MSGLVDNVCGGNLDLSSLIQRAGGLLSGFGRH